MVTAYLSLGSNIDPFYHLPVAVKALGACFCALQLSPVYQSAAIGFQGDPFLNLVAAFETDLEPTVLQGMLRALEDRHGRVRQCEPYSPRTLDIDLLLYGNQVSTCPILPRAEITRYAFVLKPLADLAPDLRHPITGVRYADLWSAFDATDQPLWLVGLDFV